MNSILSSKRDPTAESFIFPLSCKRRQPAFNTTRCQFIHVATAALDARMQRRHPLQPQLSPTPPTPPLHPAKELQKKNVLRSQWTLRSQVKFQGQTNYFATSSQYILRADFVTLQEGGCVRLCHNSRRTATARRVCEAAGDRSAMSTFACSGEA